MAKCPICNSRKGKRHCLIENTLICSVCCGNTRTEETCSECRFYQKPKRNYSKVPSYSIADMSNNLELEGYGYVIESALVRYDMANNQSLRDSEAIKILELLIDKYHFGDKQMSSGDLLVAKGVEYVENSLSQGMSGVNNEKIVKMLGVIRFVANRRTKRGREYMTVIHQYAGARLGAGF